MPKGFRFVVEVRNKKLLDDELYWLLRENGVAQALVDQPFMPMIQTVNANFMYIRWEGGRRKAKGTLGQIEVQKENGLKLWAQQVKRLLDDSVEVFGYYANNTQETLLVTQSNS